MEEDAESILKFMAANGLVANPNKIAFLLLKECGTWINQARQIFILC